MARVKGGLNARRKHNKVLKLAKGYRGRTFKTVQSSKTVCDESTHKLLQRT